MSYKRGDIVLAREGNCMSLSTGTELKVANTYNNYNPPYVSAYKIVNGLKQGSNYNCYSNDIVPATKEDRIKLYTELVKSAKEHLTRLEEELKFFKEYDCEEDYVADKIARILSSGGDAKAIAVILKERHTRIL